MNERSKSSFESPSEEVIRAFTSLRMDPNFQTIMDWLVDCMMIKALAGSKIENEKARNWEDGKVQAMERLIQYHIESRSMAEKTSDRWRITEESKVGGY